MLGSVSIDSDSCFASTFLQRAALWLNRQQNDNQRLLLNASIMSSNNGLRAVGTDDEIMMRAGSFDEESLVRTSLDDEDAQVQVSLAKVEHDDWES